MDAATIVAIVGAAAAGAGIVYGYFRARADVASARATANADERAEIRQVLDIKDEIVDSLKEANAELRGQIAQALERERQWLEERGEYKARLAAMEESYRDVVQAIVDAGLCARAATCPDRVIPGNGHRLEGLEG